MPRVRRESETPLDPGARVGRYEIVAVLGRGGMGIVYRARDVELGRGVALKCPSQALAEDEIGRKRFLREARVGAALSSPYIVAVYEVLEDRGRPWIASELVEGPSLRDAIERAGGPLPIPDVLRWGEQLAEALHAAHAHKLLHRDVKPSNVLLDPDGRARLADFGLAASWLPTGSEDTATTQTAHLTSRGVVGTPSYMSPEQILGRRLDARCDIFALGAVLYEMCTGQRAFRDTDTRSLQDTILNDEPAAIARLNYEVPDELVRIVRKALAKHPDERYATARDMAVDLRVLRRGSERAGIDDTATRRRRRRRFAGTVALSVIAGLAALLIIRGLTREPERVPTPESVAPVAEPLVTSPSNEWHGRLSPDARWMSFISDEGGQANVWVQRLDSDNPHQLTREEEPVVSSIWSADGGYVAYLVRSSDRIELKSISAPVGDIPRVVGEVEREGDAWPRLAAWTPDGLYVENNGALWLCKDEDGHLSKLMSRDTTYCRGRREYDVDPVQSRATFCALADGFVDIWVSRLDGTDPLRLTNDRFFDDHPRWLGDGSDRVLHTSNRSGTVDLWVTPLDGGLERPVPFAREIAGIDDVSADGALFTVPVRGQSLALWRADLSTATRSRLGGDALGEFAPTLAADRELVAYQQLMLGTDTYGNVFGSRIHLARVDGTTLSGARLIVDDGFSSEISPDGRYLAFLNTSAERGFAIAIDVLELSSRHLTRVADDVWFNGFREFPLGFISKTMIWGASPAELFFVVLDSSEAPVLVRRSIEGDSRASVTLGSSGEQTLGLVIAPDRRRIGTVVSSSPGDARRARLVCIDLVTLATEVLTELRPEPRTTVRLVGWDAGGRAVLALVDLPEEASPSITIHRLSPDGRLQAIGPTVAAYPETISMDPGGRYVLVTTSRDTSARIERLALDTGEWTIEVEGEAGRAVTFGETVFLDDAILYVRQEMENDIWAVSFHPER